MPNPYKRLHVDVGLWSKSEIPTEAQYRILCHLAQEGEPRMYVQGGDSIGNGARVSLSNTAHEAGREVYCGIYQFLNGCHHDRRPWITLDREITATCAKSLRAYKISKAGFEAIAQYRARNEYDESTLDLGRRILEWHRLAVAVAANSNGGRDEKTETDPNE